MQGDGTRFERHDDDILYAQILWRNRSSQGAERGPATCGGWQRRSAATSCRAKSGARQLFVYVVWNRNSLVGREGFLSSPLNHERLLADGELHVAHGHLDSERR